MNQSTYEIPKHNQTELINQYLKKENDLINNFENHFIDTIPSKENPKEIILGHGDESVYVYYFQTYLELAIHNGLKTWPCKVGRSDKDPLQRINYQSTTSLPETPKIAAIIKTDNSRALENIIHNILSYRKKRTQSSLGKEWFDTNPDEILRIVQFVKQSSLIYD